MKSTRLPLLTVALFCAALGLAPKPAAAVDAAAAQELMKTNQCGKCHSADKEKGGPSLKKIAAKYKGKPEGEQAIIKNITTAPKVKLDDGTQEEHKVIKTKDEAQLKNLAQWILAQ
ncbi:MAG TPA: c-type cytochrome [Burkholderiaceae bacterium]|nr:c-type cytochrome [Burkholderiaceae bacterium]